MRTPTSFCIITVIAIGLSFESRAQDALEQSLSLSLDDDLSIELVLIQPGTFTMGADDSRSDEDPAHEVTITKPFYLGQFEVTQEQYEFAMGVNPSHFKHPQKPVDSISWINAVAFCERLSSKTGKSCRLPTEAEWEYACRAGATTPFSFGKFDSDLEEYGWFKKNADQTTHVVGQKNPNAWGLYDIHGNVWEWCHDWYDAEYYESSPPADPRGPETGKWRIHRGGSWYDPGWAAKSSTRARIKPHLADTHYGFRICIEP